MTSNDPRVNVYVPGLTGQCPRCLSRLIESTGGWNEIGERSEDVYRCQMCGYYEDQVVQANRMNQHTMVTI